MDPAAYEEMRRLEDHHWWFAGRRRVARRLVADALGVRAAPRVVEVGCGTGGNLAWVERDWPGARTVGLDIDGAALAFSRARGLRSGLVAADGVALPFRDAAADVVLAFDVIEHFDDDRSLVREFARILAPGGSLVASVPAYPSLWSPHDDFLHHVRRYRPGELEARLEDAGLAVERRHGFNFLLLPPIAAARALKRRLQGARAPRSDFFELPGPLNACLGGLFALEAAIVRAVPVPFGLSLLVRATRPATPIAR